MSSQAPSHPPSIDAIVERAGQLGCPRALVVREARHAADRARRGEITIDEIDGEVREAIAALRRPSLRRVINATGVVLHTNLGRAPIGSIDQIEGYSNLEFDLRSGKRGKRDVHAGSLLSRLLDRPAIAVNNNAAAVYLVLHELAAGREVLVSRGELIEIGDGFRIPDIMARSGAILREVGATNKTSIEDYRSALSDRTALILRVHPSNFHISGFTAKPGLDELAALAREAGVPLYEDLGSGCLTDLREFGIHEPLVRDSFAAGVDVVSFSCDKLLGGPQSGIIAGRKDLIERVRKNQMYRAFRCDKLIVAALESTLRRLLFEELNEVPALWMIRRSANEIKARAEDMLEGLSADLVPGHSVIGGGSTPDQRLATWLIALRGDAVAWERKLRASRVPVIARIADDRCLLDLRTVFPADEGELRSALFVK